MKNKKKCRGAEVTLYKQRQKHNRSDRNFVGGRVLSPLLLVPPQRIAAVYRVVKSYSSKPSTWDNHTAHAAQAFESMVLV